MQRLDQFLSQAGVASRREAKALLKSGAVQVDGQPVRDPALRIDEATAAVTVHGRQIAGMRRVVLMLHKPAGYVTSTEDPRDRTVMELLSPEYRRLGVVPVGRLDKDTEGLLLLTNDGELIHRLISPKYEVEKCYYARHEGQADAADAEAFRQGLILRDGTRCRPAVLEPLGPGQSRVTVTEGKYHQVRRMMASRGMTVTYLRREREGGLSLGNLAPGQLRELTKQEQALLECAK